ncbi:hypothetical protein K458DRAFT_392502 [Lentithecium fluviatile CBS 122367]|uniref:Uncharacterized protein n=1 Tax=Lentithecium fluviatile CBS 122367 TaxID=1168545 RepID=A0A6G1IRH5_9PLEO|nr:hypothetical protein K458DRAFT_392502 [Lentithecium fluviatile CBS 122367]
MLYQDPKNQHRHASSAKCRKPFHPVADEGARRTKAPTTKVFAPTSSRAKSFNRKHNHLTANKWHPALSCSPSRRFSCLPTRCRYGVYTHGPSRSVLAVDCSGGIWKGLAYPYSSAGFPTAPPLTSHSVCGVLWYGMEAPPFSTVVLSKNSAPNGTSRIRTTNHFT